MARRVLPSAVALLFVSGLALGSDVWVFRFDSTSLAIATSWHDNLVFHNIAAQDAVVHLVGISNGGIPPGSSADLTVPARRTVGFTVLSPFWEPYGSDLGVVHMDVPDSVLVFSRGGASGECPSPCGPVPGPYPDLGTFSMPVFRSLVPPGQVQIHMGADLGTEPSRINVGIYNAGALPASATVTVSQACDDTVLETRTLSIPPDNAIQFGGLGSAAPHCESHPLDPNPWLRYVTVTVSEPSLSYIVNRAEPLPFHPQILLSVPIAAP